MNKDLCCCLSMLYSKWQCFFIKK